MNQQNNLPFDKDLTDVKIFIKPGFTDFRIGLRGLASMTNSILKEQPDEKSLFCFCSTRKKQVKILYHQGNGWWLLHRSIDYGKFSWPESFNDSCKVTLNQLRILLTDPITRQAIRAKKLAKRIY